MSLSIKEIKRRREESKKLGRAADARRKVKPSRFGQALARLDSVSRPWLDNGNQAIADWQKEMIAQGLRGLERATAPAQEMDEGSPWWAIIEDYSSAYGEDMSVLMGFGPKGAPPPDWMAIVNKAAGLLRVRRKEASLSDEASFGHYRQAKIIAKAVSWRETLASDRASQASAEKSRWAGSERAAKLTIAETVEHKYVFLPKRLMKKALLRRLKKNGKFDRRRAAKRMGASAPNVWTAAFGPFGQKIWENGAGAQVLKRKPQKSKEELLRVIMDAMKAGGALSVQLCPNFRELNPMAFESWEGFVEMDAERLDAVRAGWAIESSTATRDELRMKSDGIGAQRPKRANSL